MKQHRYMIGICTLASIMSGCMDSSAGSGANTGTAAQAQIAAPEAGFSQALSAAVGQCVSANETGQFNATALRGAGFSNSQYNAEEFRVQLSGAHTGKAFSATFPSGGRKGCNIITRYPDLAPQITSGALRDLQKAGYSVQGSGANMTAQKAGKTLSVTSGKTRSTSIPFYQLSITPK